MGCIKGGVEAQSFTSLIALSCLLDNMGINISAYLIDLVF